MSYPAVTLEVAFGSDPTAQNPTWTDCTDALMGFEITRGRQHELDQMQTGRLSMTLDNADRRFDPSYTKSPFYPNVVPMRRVRLSAKFSKNLIPNSSAETDTSGWSTSNATLTRDTTVAQDGLASFKLVTSAVNGLAATSPTIAISPNTAYTLSAWVKAGVSDNCMLQLSWKNAGGVDISNVSTSFTGTGAWQFVTVTGTSPANAVLSLPIVDVQSGATTIWFDAVQLEQASAFTDFSRTDGGPIPVYLFTGFVSDWEPDYGRPFYGQTKVIAYDAFDGLGSALITGVFPQESSSARIARVLEAAGWPSSTPAAGGYWKLGVSQLGTTTILGYGIPTSVLNTGKETIPASDFSASTTQTALQHLLQVTDSELGVFFIDGQGRSVFHNRHHRLQQTASVVTFTDGTTGSTSRINYAAIVPRVDRDRLANEVRVSSGSNPQTFTTYSTSDAASVQRFTRRSLARTVLLTDAVRAQLSGDFIVAARKDPTAVRFDSIMVEGHFDDNAWPHVLGREISDRVTVELTPPSSGVTVEQIVKDCYIEAITHRVVPPAVWETTYQLSPVLPSQPYWILGVSTLGVGTKLAY